MLHSPPKIVSSKKIDFLVNIPTHICDLGDPILRPGQRLGLDTKPIHEIEDCIGVLIKKSIKSLRAEIRENSPKIMS